MLIAKMLPKYCIFWVLYAFQPHQCIAVRKMTEHRLNKLWVTVAATSLNTRSTCKLSVTSTSLQHALQVQSLKGRVWMMTKLRHKLS